MDYGIIGKIEKARRYAEERNRMHVTNLKVTFEGENNPHTVTLENDHWNCDCGFFQSHSTCSHTMALERILHDMVPQIETV